MVSKSQTATKLLSRSLVLLSNPMTGLSHRRSAGICAPGSGWSF